MNPQLGREVQGRGGGGRVGQAALVWLVFCAGVGVMGLEMCASRLIAPYFGSTLAVWTSLIGLVLIFLTAGYHIGGALADRHASRELLGAIVIAAGAITLAVPLASTRVLAAAWALTPRAGILGASLVGAFALFALPMVLLGCVCPFAMKLSLDDLGRTGRAAGRIYAVSALGSVVGTFLPVLVMIDRWGVRHSIMAFGALLVVAGVILLGRARFLPAGAPVLLLLAPLPPPLSAKGVIAQRESRYNSLQVVAVGDSRILVVDWGAFSVYTPGQFRTHQYFDQLLLAPLLRPTPPEDWLESVLIIGLGAGTGAKQITQAFGPVHIDGVEIDPAIVELGRRYFDMSEPNLQVHTTDGRAFLAGRRQVYDWVIVDAYQGSDIPFHLTTREFFGQVRDSLRPGGVLAVNVAWWMPGDPELLDRLAASAGAAFPSVFVITGISESSGAVLLAGGSDASADNILPTAAALGHSGLAEIAAEVLSGEGPLLRAADAGAAPLTDDCAPVGRLADRFYRRARRDAYAAERRAVTFGDDNTGSR